MWDVMVYSLWASSAQYTSKIPVETNCTSGQELQAKSLSPCLLDQAGSLSFCTASSWRQWPSIPHTLSFPVPTLAPSPTLRRVLCVKKYFQQAVGSSLSEVASQRPDRYLPLPDRILVLKWDGACKAHNTSLAHSNFSTSDSDCCLYYCYFSSHCFFRAICIRKKKKGISYINWQVKSWKYHWEIR